MALQFTSPLAPAKFGVYENAAITSSLSRQTIRRKPWHFPLIFMLFCASIWLAWNVHRREESLVNMIQWSGIRRSLADSVVQCVQWSMISIFVMTLSALCKVLSLPASPDTSLTASTRAKLRSRGSSPISIAFGSGQAPGVSPRQWYEPGSSLDHTCGVRQRPPRSRQSPSQSMSPLLVPLHPQVLKSNKSMTSPWSGRSGLVAPANSPAPATSTASPAPSVSPQQMTPFPAAPPLPATPASQGSPAPSTAAWSKDRTRSGRLDFAKDEIDNEKKLAEFLAEVDGKLADGAGWPAGLATPPPSVQGFGTGLSPAPVLIPASISSTPRSAVRALRMSPTAPKTGSPKKGDLEMPLPMSIEQAAEVFKRLGIYSQVEQWRDALRQWFSDVLLNPLVRKLDTSHVQAMAAAANLGISISVGQVGGSKQDGGMTPISTEGSQQEWLTTMVPDEDAFLHQLRAALLHARDGPIPTQYSVFGLASPQERVYNPSIQICLDAVTEHQRLKALVKGEWVKGLLPQTSVRADYAVQRIQDLAEGTCVKSYEFWMNGEVYDKNSKRWTSELPSDAHLLLYLFCSLLEHPQWMLHVDPMSYPSTQSSNNSLFVAGLPNKERYPENYIAIISGAPPVLHSGATILAVGKPSPPVFALYWDKKLQYSFQGRSALWDAILLLCYRIKVAHGGVVRGIKLGSPAFNLLSVLEPSIESPAR